MDGKSLRDKLVGSDNERAVSPVIGVILMVAITVILAAVIATLVMDIGGNQEEPISAGVDVSEDGTDITVQVTDMGNADGVIIADGNGDKLSSASTITTTGTSDTVTHSGEYIVYAYKGSGPSSTDNVEDVTEQVAVVADGDTS